MKDGETRTGSGSDRDLKSRPSEFDDWERLGPVRWCREERERRSSAGWWSDCVRWRAHLTRLCSGLDWRYWYTDGMNDTFEINCTQLHKVAGLCGSVDGAR